MRSNTSVGSAARRLFAGGGRFAGSRFLATTSPFCPLRAEFQRLFAGQALPIRGEAGGSPLGKSGVTVTPFRCDCWNLTDAPEWRPYAGRPELSQGNLSPSMRTVTPSPTDGDARRCPGGGDTWIFSSRYPVLVGMALSRPRSAHENRLRINRHGPVGTGL